MGIFIFLVILTIFFSIFYLLRFSRNKKFFLCSFCFIFFASLIIYNFKGNKNSFSYSNKLEKQIRVLSKDPEKFADNYDDSIHAIDHSNADICFGHLEIKGFEMHSGHMNEHGLESGQFKRFEKVISGHFHKADLHYNNALKYFPNNEVILYELAMLKKNTNQLMSAISILEKIYKINPKNFNSIELNLEILKTINNKKLLNAKIERLKKENFLKKEEINLILKKLNL